MSASRPLRFLVAESEPPKDREKRRASVGQSSGESYIETLQRLQPGAECKRIKPADADGAAAAAGDLSDYDAVFITGSPLHLWQDTPETRREVDFMRAAFSAGVPRADSAQSAS